jgi:5,5'-dehydrodivanillate O-demethylase
MGKLLRRYWHPVAAASELDTQRVKPLRLLGEDLVLYRGVEDEIGLIARYCAHRSGDLSAGIVEPAGLRCPAHGWLYDRHGQCLDQPLEYEPFWAQVRIDGYRASVKAGLVWAYLGPEPAPQIPDWEPFSWDDGLMQIALTHLPCNWLQCQESALDPFAVLAETTIRDHGAPAGYRLPGVPVIDEFEHGFSMRLTDEASGDGLGLPARACLWPNGLAVVEERSCRFEWRVPVDDENTLSIAWFADRAAPDSTAAAEARTFYWYAPIGDLAAGEPLRSHVLNRQFAIWIYQGRVLDRTKEHLTEADAGVTMLRSRLLTQADLVADGGEPKAVIRDGRPNYRLKLPSPPDPEGIDAGGDTFDAIAGQPPEAAEAYARVRESWLAREPQSGQETATLGRRREEQP